MPALQPTIYVIIPFFQTKPEPLILAIRSILAQEEVDRPHVLIIDDGSPISARQIVDENFPGNETFVQIIEQKNSGAAKARNMGLDNTPDSASYIAFLDSDDEWTPDHLTNAVQMLAQDYDFYFADHQRSEWKDGKFAMTGLSLEQNLCLDEASGLYAYTGDILLPVMNEHLVQTSSVVFRRSVMQDIRFPADLVLGEDEIFWIKAMRRARKIGFCKEIEVLMGKGVNISQRDEHGNDWANIRAFQLMAQNICYWQSIPELLPEEAQLDELRTFKLRQLRLDLAASVWHCLRHKLELPIRPIIDATMTDPQWLFSLFTLLFNRFSARNPKESR